MKQSYLYIFEGVRSDVIYTAKYNANSDICTKYLGTLKMRRQGELKAEHRVHIMEDCYIPGKLLDRPYSKILLDIRASKLFLSKTLYLSCPSLHFYLCLYQGQRIF